MSDNLADAQRMAEAAANGGPVLDFGFTMHFHPGLRRLKELIASGELGTVLHVHCRVGTYVTLVNSVNRHYRQVTEEHFEKAVSAEDKPPKRAASATVPVVAESQPADRTNPYRKGAEGGRKASEKSGVNSGARKDEKAAQNPAYYPILLSRMESQKTQKVLGNKDLKRFSKTQCNPMRLHQYPLGESNEQQLSALLPDTYEESDMPGGANSGALQDEFDPNLQSPETCTGNSLLDAIRLLTDMPPSERAALIELLKTWG